VKPLERLASIHGNLVAHIHESLVAHVLPEGRVPGLIHELSAIRGLAPAFATGRID